MTIMTIDELYQKARAFSDYPSSLSDLREKSEREFIHTYVPQLESVDPEELRLFLEWWKSQDVFVESFKGAFIELEVSLTEVTGTFGIRGRETLNNYNFYPLLLFGCDSLYIRVTLDQRMIQLNENREYVGTHPDYASRMDVLLGELKKILSFVDPDIPELGINELIIGEGYGARFVSWVDENLTDFKNGYISSTLVPPEEEATPMGAMPLPIHLYDWYEYTGAERPVDDEVTPVTELDSDSDSDLHELLEGINIHRPRLTEREETEPMMWSAQETVGISNWDLQQTLIGDDGDDQ